MFNQLEEGKDGNRETSWEATEEEQVWDDCGDLVYSGRGVERSNSEYILKIMLIGLASGLDIKGEWKGDFWFTHLIGWRCCYSDEKNWRKGGFGRGWSEGQFWTCCFWNVSETSKGRRQTGSWEAQGQTHQSSRERSGLRFTLQPTLVSLLAHLFPVKALGTISWITDLLITRSNGWFSISFSSAFDTVGHTVLETHHVTFMAPLSWFSLFLWLASFSMQFKSIVSKF